MGTKVPDPPIEYSNDCVACRIGGYTLWEAGETPKYVYVYFAGIEKCPLATKEPPNGQTFKLTQDPLNPCHWRHVGSEWTVDWYSFDWIEMQSRVVLFETGGLVMFSSRLDNCPPECSVYHNGIVVCQFPVAGRFGVSVVHWMGIVLSIIVGLLLPTSSQIMHELFVTDDDKIVHKFCLPKYSMNVKVLHVPP